TGVQTCALPIWLSGPLSVSQKRHAPGGTHFCAQSRVRNSFPLVSPWGQNCALNRALGLAASHTLSAQFPCMCPVHPHMSAGQDFSVGGAFATVRSHSAQ